MRLLIAVVNVNPGLTYQDVQTVLQSAGGWARVSPTTWVVHTHHSTQGLTEALRPLVHPSGSVFVSGLDTRTSYGWMSQEFWTWMQQRT